MSMSKEIFRDILARCDQELFKARQGLKYCGFFGRRHRRDQLLDWMGYSIQTLLRAQSYLYNPASAIEAPSGGETGNTGSTEGESAAREAGDAQPSPDTPKGGEM